MVVVRACGRGRGPQVPERGEPMMICQVMCQQINCTTNREGDIVEGSENEIRAVIYAFVMQVSHPC